MTSTLVEFPEVEAPPGEPVVAILPQSLVQRLVASVAILFDPRAHAAPAGQPAHRPQTGIEYVALYHPETLAWF